MDKAKVSVWYNTNIDRFKEQSVRLQRRYNVVSIWRIAAFLVFIGLIGTSIYLGSTNLLLGTMVIFGLGFGLLVKRHNQIGAQKLGKDLLVQINQEELKRLSLQLHPFPDGSQYIDRAHPYSLDLDLFGSHSLFQWLNRTVTKGGETFLVDSMLRKSTPEDIGSKQLAVKELAASPEWGQQFRVGGMAHQKVDHDFDRLLNWVQQKTEIQNWFVPALVILPVLALTLTVAYFMGVLDFYFLLGILVVNGILLKKVQPLAQHTYEETHRSINTLKAYEAMIADIEKARFTSPLLQELQQPFHDHHMWASQVIGQLKDLLSRIETRQNFIYWIFNIFLLMDLVWLIQAKSWKGKYRNYISRWFDAIGQYEMLVSLGLHCHAHPEYHFPVISKDPYDFKGKDLGHPLIPETERVNNDFEVTGMGSVAILTGSNMSGKSTFLRCIGVNSVLAAMGSSVCAQQLVVGNYSLFTSMRTTDSLEQHISSFYAELKRLNQLIRSLNEGQPTLFLLDEILKGTNSHDRHLGASALIKQLHGSTAFGLVSTHDLALGELANDSHEIKNFSFNSQLQNGKLIFDYRLQPGVCSSFNASELMAQMGIDIKKAQDH